MQLHIITYLHPWEYCYIDIIVPCVIKPSCCTRMLFQIGPTAHECLITLHVSRRHIQQPSSSIGILSLCLYSANEYK